MMNSNGADTKYVDTHWYNDDEVNTLLTNIVAERQNTRLLTAMLGTDWFAGNTLKSQLIQVHQKRLQDISQGRPVEDNIIIPVTLGNDAGQGNHWVLLYIKYQRDLLALPQIIYIDPFGNPIPIDILTSLRDQQLFPDVEVSSSTACLQQDTYNCGPWIIAIAQLLLEQEQPSNHINVTDLMQNLAKLDIQQVRQFHREFLSSADPNPQLLQEHPDGLELLIEAATSVKECEIPVNSSSHAASKSIPPLDIWQQLRRSLSPDVLKPIPLKRKLEPMPMPTSDEQPPKIQRNLLFKVQLNKPDLTPPSISPKIQLLLLRELAAHTQALLAGKLSAQNTTTEEDDDDGYLPLLAMPSTQQTTRKPTPPPVPSGQTLKN